MSAIDKYEKRKEQNRINQANRRALLREDEEYKKKIAEKAREQYANRMAKVKTEMKVVSQEQVKKKVGAMKYATNIINDVFDKILKDIPVKEEREPKAHQGQTEKIRRKQGRPKIYQLKDDMTDSEKKIVQQKLRKAEYMKVWMANKRRELKEIKNKKD